MDKGKEDKRKKTKEEKKDQDLENGLKKCKCSAGNSYRDLLYSIKGRPQVRFRLIE